MPLTEAYQVPGEPIFVFAITGQIVVPQDPQQASEKFFEMTKDAEGKIHRILDFSQAEIHFSDVALGLQNDVAMQMEQVVNYMVGTDELVAFAAEAAKQDQFGGLDVKLFTSRDDAIAAARAGINS
ncbi:MAG: hypothetical protein JXA10_15335 [Anaerolineae bacterium]|nr:hypothetical protein [Anaerolineae bacterium]